MKRTQVLAALMGLGACLGLVGLSAAQENKVSEVDQKFVRAAASRGLAEVKAGELAKDRAKSDAVKKFAEQMVSDHDKANKDLMDLASKKGIRVSKDMREQERTPIDTLSKLKGPAFDAEFLRQQVTAHKEAVSLFEQESKKGKDEDLRSFAEKTLPTLREHLKEVTKLAGGERPSR
jgi:putative membrane protein